MTMDSLAGGGGVARQPSTQGNTGDPTRRGPTGLAPSSGGSRAGSRRGSSYREHSADHTTTEEGRSPGSRRASTSPGAGDWREPVTSWFAPATPRGAGPHGRAGAGCACACRGATLVREPDAGQPHVRFDERTGEPPDRCGWREMRASKPSSAAPGQRPCSTLLTDGQRGSGRHDGEADDSSAPVAIADGNGRAPRSLFGSDPVVVARPARAIHDTRLLSDLSMPPSCIRPDVWLPGYRAHGHGHPLPGCAPGRRPRQVEHDTAHRTFHPDRQLE